MTIIVSKILKICIKSFKALALNFTGKSGKLKFINGLQDGGS